MRHSIIALSTLCILGVFTIGPSHAIMISLAPPSTVVTTGGAITVDVIISGLGAGIPPSVGTFDLDVAYDAALLSPTGVVFGPFLGDPGLFEALTAVDLSTAGIVDFAEVSLLSPADLDALQPSSFILASLGFVGIGDGISAFQFVGDIRIDDAFGNKLTVVPEPASLSLFALGTLALVGLRPGVRNRRLS